MSLQQTLQESAANLLATIPEKQVLLSPFSLSSAMCMAALGAKLDTLQEIKDVFQCNNKEYELLVRDMTARNATIANALFPDRNFVMNPKYIMEAKRYYDAVIMTQDFLNPIESSKNINAFVSKKTNGRITDVIDPSLINDETKAIIVNVLHVKFSWLKPFESALTTSEPFLLASNERVNVEMMKHGSPSELLLVREYGNEAIGVVLRGSVSESESPYSMEFILPKSERPDAIFAIEKRVFEAPTSEKLKDVNVQIPKFDLSNLLNLKEPLENLGIRKAFTKHADFSGMSDVEGLYITNVVQNTRVTVNEQGVDASAVTAAIFGTTSLPSEIMIFKVDRPFIAHIRYKDTLLFSLRILDPR